MALTFKDVVRITETSKMRAALSDLGGYAGHVGSTAIYFACSANLAHQIFGNMAVDVAVICVSLPNAKLCASYAEAHEFFREVENERL
jgi:hypothetical protein